jgi:hypothetical protein
MATTWTQVTGRFRADDGNETAANWLWAEGASGTVTVGYAGYKARIRIQAQEAGTTASTLTARLYIAQNGSAYAQIGTATTAICSVVDSTYITDDEATSKQCGGTNLFVAGHMDDVNGQCTATGTIVRYSRSEHEYMFQVNWARVVQGSYVDFNEYATTSAFATYTVVPRLTIQYLAVATLTGTLGNITSSITAQAPAAGSVISTLGDTSIVATSTLSNSAIATLAGILGDVSISATSTIANTVYTGTLTGTLGNTSSALTGALLASATLSKTLDSISYNLISTLTIAGSLNAQLGNASIASTSTLSIAGIVSGGLSAITILSNGALLIRGTADGILDPLTLIGTSLLIKPIEGQVNSTLALLVLLASGSIVLPPGRRKVYPHKAGVTSGVPRWIVQVPGIDKIEAPRG